MIKKRVNWTGVSLVIFLFISALQAQNGSGNVYWHIDPDVKTCSMVLDPTLTQDQWHKFTEQAGAILTFKSLAPATTLGKMNYKIAIDYSSTPVNQHDLAWINTFTHPDENCPLGDRIEIPTIRASVGITHNMDVGAYWTTAPGSNYGAVGGEYKYAFIQESRKMPATAVRASFSILTGVPDFNFNIYSIDLMASKNIYQLNPYVGFKESLFNATETTPKVDLNKARLSILQGFVGVSYSIWMINLAAEYNVSSVNSFAVAIGFDG
ncbi:MAG: hypothetical protein JSW33_01385 [bacterium]|nr:MAG: hypothetical protein JSW33_01385 [bacterium]